MKLSLAVSSVQPQQHLLPVWKGARLAERQMLLDSPEKVRRRPRPDETDTWAAASSHDAQAMLAYVRNDQHAAYFEHGTGLQWYPNGVVERILHLTRRGAIMAPNWFVAELWEHAGAPDVRIVGTPKMDRLAKIEKASDGQTVALSLHWTGMYRQRRTTIAQWEETFARLAATPGLTILGHGHPKFWPKMRQLWERIGVEPVRDFADIVKRADVLAIDHSSVMYEWQALGRPVVQLQRKLYDRLPIRLSGLLYNHHDLAAPAVGQADVLDVLRDALACPERYTNDVSDLYPYIGSATRIALGELRSLTGSPRPARPAEAWA